MALETDETNDDGICMNTRDEISQCGLPAKDDLGSEAEKQKHSEIRSSLGDQILLCELPRDQNPTDKLRIRENRINL